MDKLLKTNYQKILVGVATLSLLAFAISAIQVGNGKFAVFEPSFFAFGIPWGAWVWGDLMIFSLLWFVISLILIKIKNPDYFWIVFFIFWFIRSSGEAIYFFNQQFSPIIPWPQNFPRVWILKNLTDPEFWVWYQVVWQSIATFSLFGLIYKIPKILKER